MGGYYGAVMTQKVPSHTLRVAVILIGLVTAAHLDLRTY